jgi:ATP-binding cassette subfamily B multidrug efflux pump
MSLLTATLAILEVSLFSFMGELVDLLTQHTAESLFQEEGLTLVIMSALVLVAMPLIVLLHGLIIYQSLLGNYPMSIRWLAHRYLLKQSVSFYQNDFAGRIANKVMQTALAVRETVTKLLDVIVYILVYFTAMVVTMGSADMRLMIPMLVWLVLYMVIQMLLLPRLKKVSTEQADARSLMTGRIVDSYTNISTVKLFAHTDKEAEYAKQSMTGFLSSVYRQMRLVTLINFSVQFINYLLFFSVAALAIWLWQANAITIGAIAIAMSLALRLNGLSQWIMWEISSLSENIGTVADGINTLSVDTEIEDIKNANNLTVSNGEINFNNVTFNYGEKAAVIDNLNLHIKAGEKVGLVGRSGAGKSTLVNLLMRFYDVEKGTIIIDGQDISQVKQDSLREYIGMVTQDTSLLHRSVKENILYGKPDATDEELATAIDQSEAGRFIDDLTDPHGNKGLDAQVGERGVKLSGGQRQRIAIARVLLKNAPILLLDEATSALDSEVEAAIQTSLYKLMEGKTVIAIAHRLSTIAAMDRLIVLDEGKIVEQGSHQELIASGGIYAQLWQHQTGGFLGVD